MSTSDKLLLSLQALQKAWARAHKIVRVNLIAPLIKSAVTAFKKYLKVTLNSVILGIFGTTILGLDATAAQATNSIRTSLEQTQNVGPTWVDQDRFNDVSITANYQRNYRRSLGLSQFLNYSLLAGGRYYQDWQRSRLSIGGEIGLVHKFGIGFHKPTLSLVWRGTQHFYESSLQDSFNSRVSVRLSRPLGEAFNIALGLASEWQITDSELAVEQDQLSKNVSDNPLDRQWLETSVSVEYFINSLWSIPISVAYIDGDLENFSRARASSFGFADAVGKDPNLDDRQYVYRYDGSAWSASLAASRLLKNGSTLNFAVNYVQADAKNGLVNNNTNSPTDISYDQTSWTITWATRW